MRRRSVILVIRLVFVEENSLRMLAVNLAKRWREYHLSDDAGKVRTSQLVTSDTTTNVYAKAMLVVDFDNFMRIITIP